MAHFFLMGAITSPLHHYLIYGVFFNWEAQRAVRHKVGLKDTMKYELMELGVFKLLFEEAKKKLGHLDISPLYDGKYKPLLKEYVGIEEAYIEKLGYSPYRYSFDK
jgi:predicted RNase H-related nuclease YkuK (DUF458 family)